MKKTAQEKATHFLINAKVNSVRFRDQAHIILNGGHYQIGDIVDPKTGLIFTGIKERKLEFQDRNKTIYRKSF